MSIASLIVAGLSIGTIVFGAGMAFCQDYPNRLIRIITLDVGGGADIVARLIAQGISAPIGQPVIVDNRPMIIASDTVSKAPPDGYTLLFNANTLWLLPFMRDNVPWDPVHDFSPITLAFETPVILVVHPSLPVSSVKELIALAKARPRELNYASGGSGTNAHLSAELLKARAGINIVHIPYKGAAAGLNALISNEVQLMFPVAIPAMPHVRSGKLRALAVTGAQPSSLVPGLPTVAAAGLPGYESVVMTGMFAPGSTPLTVINRLNQEVVRFLKQAEVKEKLSNIGIEVVGSSPQEFAAAIKLEMARMEKVIKDAGIRAE